MIVSKFGGTSLASGHDVRLVSEILRSDARRQVCVVSAPGRTANSIKVTDLLIKSDRSTACERFCTLIDELELPTK